MAEERLRRAKGVNFIYQAGILLSLPQTTLWVAGMFFHRFYMRSSMVEEKGGIHHYVGTASACGKYLVLNKPFAFQNIAATALFLANKTEENCRKTKDLIIAVGKVAQKNAKAIIDEQSKEYWRWRDSILTYEELMLETLTFDLMVDIAYHQLYKQLEDIERIHHKPIRDAAWAFCNDACLTVLPLLMPARDIATSAIFFATTVTREKIDDVRGEAWWRFLDGNEVLINKAIAVMTEFYKENPLKKQDSKLPGSPEFNLENTRRRGENIDGSSRGGTPMGTDRGTQSPRGGLPGRANGRDDHINDAAEGSVKKEEGISVKNEETATDPNASMIKIELAAQINRGDSDTALKAAANEMAAHDHANGGGLRSPNLPGSKRKSVEMDVDSDGEREAKRARLADEDEGEIL